MVDPADISRSAVDTKMPSQAKKPLRSTLLSRNITVGPRRTSVRLEPEMWGGLTEICRREAVTLHALCTVIAQNKPENTSLTAAIRVFIMMYFRAAATEEGHVKAGHGYGLAGLISRLSVPPIFETRPAALPLTIEKAVTSNKPMIICSNQSA